MLIDSDLARKCKFDTNYKGCAYREETDFSFRLNLEFNAKLVRNGKAKDIKLYCDALTPDEREIIRQGCLINYYKSQM